MDVKEAVLSRRSIRAYEDRPIRREDLEDIWEAGMYAPSAVNFQPCYFFAIQNPEDMYETRSPTSGTGFHTILRLPALYKYE